ncbi:MAG TPA: hypothetical protein ENK85_11835 [Saprospiraceae bacterium]|nr:hypothetical protein [Saprospiraceae bacterium]
MKKIGILLLLSVVILATSCKKDPVNPQPTKEELITGDWHLESFSTDDGMVIIGLAGATDTTTFTIQSKNENYQLELNENKSYTASGQMTLVQTTTSTDPVEVEEISVDTTSSGTWVIDGDDLVLTSGDEVSNNKIIELTADKLKMETVTADTVQEEVFGFMVDVVTKNTVVSVFKK